MSVLLVKPVSRATLLLGKYAGVLAFVFVQASYFVVGTWLALGVRTGIWETHYLLSVPLLLLHFAIFFSFSLLLAVCMRSTVLCVFGSVAFWLICWGMNFGRNAVAAASEMASQGSFFRAAGLAGGTRLLGASQAGRSWPVGLRCPRRRDQFFPHDARRDARLDDALGRHVPGVHRLRVVCRRPAV